MILLWTDNLSVGIVRFDEDHRRLIRMLNELHRAARYRDADGNMDGEELEIALHRFENHALLHCTQEEIAMAKTGFPDLEKHKMEHQKLAGIIADMAMRFEGSTSPQHAEEIMQVAYDWIINHINVTDKEYSEYLTTHGVF